MKNLISIMMIIAIVAISSPPMSATETKEEVCISPVVKEHFTAMTALLDKVELQKAQQQELEVNFSYDVFFKDFRVYKTYMEHLPQYDGNCPGGQFFYNHSNGQYYCCYQVGCYQQPCPYC